MEPIKKILADFDPTSAKYISREFQAFGIYLAQELNDFKHKSLYIKLAKTVPRAVLEEALRSVKEAYNVKNKAGFFMWKLKELKKT